MEEEPGTAAAFPRPPGASTQHPQAGCEEPFSHIPGAAAPHPPPGRKGSSDAVPVRALRIASHREMEGRLRCTAAPRSPHQCLLPAPAPPTHPRWSRPPRSPPAFPASRTRTELRPPIGCGAGGSQPMAAPRVAVSLGQKTQAGRGRARARGGGAGWRARSQPAAGARAAAAEGTRPGPRP